MNPTATNPMFAKFDQALGKTTPTTGSSPVSSRAQEIRALSGSGGDAPGLGERIGTDLKTRGAELDDTLHSGQTPMSKGLQIAGHGAGLVGDAVGETAKSVVSALPNAKAEGEALANDPIVQLGAHALKAGGDLWAAFQKAHPEIAGDAGAIANIASLIPTLGAGKVGAEVAKELPTLAKTAVSATKEAVMGTAESQAAKESKGVIDAIRQTEETMTPTMKKEAIDQGRQTVSKTRTGGTKVDYTPTPEIERAAEILQDKNVLTNPVTSKDEPHVVLAKTKSAISRLGQDAEKYLDENPVKITNNEDFEMFSKLRADADKVSTPEEMHAYDQQITLFNKQLQGRGGYTTANYYRALKDWESDIAEKLPRGKEALIDPTGVANAKLRAASDIRKAVRDLISSKHPEFQPKMHDLASLYEAKDVAIHNASKVKSQTLTEKHPGIKTAATAVIGGAGVLEGGKRILTGSF